MLLERPFRKEESDRKRESGIQNIASKSKVQDLNSAAQARARSLRLAFLFRGLNRNIQSEAADTRARARLGVAKVCELDDPLSVRAALDARHREPREVEQHPRTLVRRSARDE
jgi:hypothetical protein